MILSTADGSADGLRGQVAAVSYVGDAVEYQIDLGERMVRAKAQPFETLAEGSEVLVRVPPERWYLLPSTPSQAAVGTLGV